MPTRRSSQAVTPTTARTDAMLADLRRAGLKMTPQRSALVKLFATDESHPTAQALFERLQPAFPSMSFATVYNTLDALARAGLSSTLRLGQAARFDPNTTPHHHTVCDLCGDVRDVPADEPASESALLTKTASGHTTHGGTGTFRVRAIERIYRGTCERCASSSRPSAHAKVPPPAPHEQRSPSGRRP